MRAADQALADFIAGHALPWGTNGATEPLLERIGNAPLVMIGEASHGTKEFYEWRAEISKQLIREKGFSFVAVEGDWPDCYEVNRYVKHYDTSYHSSEHVLQTFRRWPTWMWANVEVANFAAWLHGFNEDRPANERTGFYGLDVYSLWESMKAVVEYLRKVDPVAADQVRQAYRCFDPYGGDSTAYAYDTPLVPGECEDEVVQALNLIIDKRPSYPDDEEGAFSAEQNALVARNAEQYYRTMVRGSSASWNIRDRHMAETLDALMARNSGTKGIVWAHNTHVGDARATDMAAASMFNIGQLGRQTYGRDRVVLIGFGSYEGEVIAGRYWDAPTEKMPVPPAKPGSFEALLHERGSDSLLLTNSPALPSVFLQPYGHRAIGVVYNPRFEHGNYVPSIIPERYDAFIFIDKTSALHPLNIPPEAAEKPDETYPFGL